MSGLYAIAGALLVLSGCTARPDDVVRWLRAAYMLAGVALMVCALVVSIVAATVA